MSNERQIPTSGPVDNITFTVLSGGEPINQVYSVISVWVMKEVNKIVCAELILHDGDAAAETFLLSEAEEFQPGKELEIQAGYASNESSIFKGIISKQSIKAKTGMPSVLSLELRDASVKLTIGRKNKYFFSSTDSDIIKEIADEYGLDTDIEATDLTHDEMVQFYSTDWDFIVTRAEKNGKLVVAQDGLLRVFSPDLDQDPVVNPIYGDSIVQMESEIDVKTQYASVTSTSWDYSALELLEAEAVEPKVEKQGVLKGSDLSSILELAVFELKHCGRIKDEELQAWADAQMLKSRLSKIRGSIKIQGFPDVNPGDVVELRGVGKNFNGNVFVSAVGHTLSKGVWYTDIQFGLKEKWFSKEEDIIDTPASGLVPGISGLQIGIVSQLGDDPDGEDRVLVKMPLMNSQDDGIWARVASLDAGENRGSFFRPEIGDEVILGFLNDDPRHPVILGMLNSSAKPAPVVATDDNHEKGFVTRSGIKLMFDDDKISITLETPNGNSIILSDDAKGLTFTDENKNSIELSKDGIAIKSAKDIMLEAKGDVNIKGVNVAQSASAKFSAEGSAGAEITTDAIASVKGSLVKIN
ncbi:MAG: type VI secretion system tip protein VgrG [Bacteroidetes bacterium]|nr:type VI secretion system tip protein VgrG [Bacteroidota bacterium]